MYVFRGSPAAIEEGGMSETERTRKAALRKQESTIGFEQENGGKKTKGYSVNREASAKTPFVIQLLHLFVAGPFSFSV
jgi:hypothetical protein